MRLLQFLGCMIFAGVVEYVLWCMAIKFFESRFLRKAQAVCFLYDATNPLIEGNFNEDNSMKVFIKYKYCGCKIKFHNALEASLKMELLIQKALKNYYIVKWLLEWVENETESEKLEIDEAKEFLEEMCHEMREIINNQAQELQKGEL